MRPKRSSAADEAPAEEPAVAVNGPPAKKREAPSFLYANLESQPLHNPRDANGYASGKHELVTVSVCPSKNEGDTGEPQDFLVHKNFLCHSSPYFDAAFNGKLTEGETQKVELLDIDPATFSIFVTWIYAQRIRDGDTDRVTLNKLLQLWLLADRLLAPKLQNAVMDILMSGCFTGHFEMEILTYVYDGTLSGSPLRLFILETWAKNWSNGTGAKSLYNDFPSEFFKEVLEYIRTRAPEQTKLIRLKPLERQDIHVSEEFDGRH